MYFYIFEQVKGINCAKQYNKIKEYIATIGISGQYNTESPARSAEEIATMGLERGFNTIVVVGTDHIVNKVAKILSQANNAVLGVIPIDENQSICRLIGTTSWKEACDALKQRYLKTTNLTYLPPNKYFITDAQIYSQGDNPTTLTINGKCQANFQFTEIIIRPGMIIEIIDSNYGISKFTKSMNWLFGKPQPIGAKSIFNAKKIALTGKKSLFILVNKEIVAKSPLSMEIIDKVLKIITIRSMMNLNQENKENQSVQINQE